MVLTHAPELVGAALFESADSQTPPIEEEGFGGKLDRICRIIGLQLGNAVAGAKLVHDSENSVGGDDDGLAEASEGLRAVLNSKSPENAFSFAESAVYANDRVIATLVRHLVEHVVIDHELRAMAADARRRAADDLRDIPSTMVDFVNRLMASGVVVDDVRNMSKGRLALVVSAIKDMGHQEALDAVPDNLPTSTWLDAKDSSPIVAPEQDVGSLSHPSDEAADTLMPMATVPTGGMWDVIDVSHTGYRIEELPIGSDKGATATRMQLPPDPSMRKLAMPNSLEATLADGAECNAKGAFAQRFVGRYCTRTGTVLTEQERRLWLFLLFEVRTLAIEHQLGRNGFFDGVMLPTPKGSSRVRQLLAIDRDKLAEALDASALAGPAVVKR